MAIFGILFVIACYLLGSFPHLYCLAKISGLSTDGDLHLKLWQQRGRCLGLMGILLDIAKGVIVILAGRAFEMDLEFLTFGGLAVITGQMWPVFSRFDGEKGNSTAVGVIATLTPHVFLFCIIPMIIGLLVKVFSYLSQSRLPISEKLKFRSPPSLSLPLGMLAGFLSSPLISYWLGEPDIIFWNYLVLFLLIVLRRATARDNTGIKDNTAITKIVINRILFDRSRI
ncbi:MAG: glycerol-3-phosphate acyltransferase [Dehalococcoidales bacterium]